ncbi:MAG: response regulator [Nitrospinota bacterium]
MQSQNKGSTILVVEDSEVQAMILKQILIGKGYRVNIAKNGAEGLSIVRKEKPMLIISDILMPVMDGYTMCREIKRDKSLSDIPVILLTQLTDAQDIIRRLETTVEIYITKPFNYDGHTANR